MKSWECREVDELLGAYVLSAVSDQERSAADGHLAHCGGHESAIEGLACSSALLTLAGRAREPQPRLRTRRAIVSDSAVGTVPLGWGAKSLPVGSHVCAFQADDERLRQTMAFLGAGFHRPADGGVLFADRSRFGPLLTRLQEGYDGSLMSLVDRGRLVLIDGPPRVDELVERIGQRLDQAMRDGYGVIRFLGFIAWNQPGWPDPDALVELEKKVNDIVRRYPAVFICTYHVLRLSGRSLMDGGLRTHPIMILDNRVVLHNPFSRAA